MTYSEKLKDPRWQKKRLEILSRDKFTCQYPCCYEDTKTLHVHHLDYIKDADPWEYPDEYLLTLCEDCHEYLHKYSKEIEDKIIHYVRLRLRDTFIKRCLIDLLAEKQDIGDFIFDQWDNMVEENIKIRNGNV